MSYISSVDDLTLAEAINLPNQLVSLPASDRPQPDTYHARTGHVLPVTISKVYNQLQKTNILAKQNDMKINFDKTKIIVFNPCKKTDFMPKIVIDDHELEVVNETRLLGLTLRSDMKWISNTNNMVSKANKRLWILRRLKNLGAKIPDLLDVYTKQIRIVLELAVPAWQGAISKAEKIDLERIEKSPCHILLGSDYTTYKHALQTLQLETLEDRRVRLALKFGLKAEKHPKFQKWFKTNVKSHNTRHHITKYSSVRANHTSFAQSAISYLTNLLNVHYSTK